MTGATTGERIPLPSRARARRLAVPLTPLADTMFQILIFFMLASNLTPYSTLRLQSGGAVADGAGGAGAGDDPAGASGTVLWTLEPDGLRVAGQLFALDAVPDLAHALPPDAQVVLILRDRTRVRDVAGVLERLTGSGIAAVRIAAGGA